MLPGGNGFNTANMPDDTGLQAFGWVTVFAGGRTLYLPAWITSTP